MTNEDTKTINGDTEGSQTEDVETPVEQAQAELEQDDTVESIQEATEPLEAAPVTGDTGDWQKKAAEYMESLQRARADFTNYKRRVEKELQEGRERGAIDAISKVLPIIDDFERALNNVPEEIQENPWVTGTSMLLPKLQRLLADYDIEIIDPVGEEFNPNFHEAIGMEESDEVESGHVTVTLQKGYRSGDRVLRSALVRVAN